MAGTVTIGVAKPLPCSTVVGGEKANGHSMQSSQVSPQTKLKYSIVYNTFNDSTSRISSPLYYVLRNHKPWRGEINT